MRGLPPPPPGVCTLFVEFSVDGTFASFTHAIAVPGSEACTAGELESVRAALVAVLLPFTTAITHSGAEVTRVDLRSWGTPRLDMHGVPADNHGAWTGGQVATAASVITWATADNGRGRFGRTFVPGFPDAFTDDHSNVNATGVLALQNASITYVEAVAALTGISGGNLAHGVLTRVRGGAPLATAEFSPTLSMVPSFIIGTLDRRRNARFR